MTHEYPSDAVIDASQFRTWQTFVDTSDAAHVSLRGYLMAKRVLDLTITIPLLIVLSPLLIVVALTIKLWDRGSVFFTQTRVGQGGKEFTCYKFRSMVPDAEQLKDELLSQNHHDDPRTFKIPRDPRITWFGRIIRKTSIDELPQLLNVVAGDMSLVGPRPPVPSEVNLYSDRDRRRLHVQPGITCIWQVSGRGDLPFTEQVRLDLEYIQNRSLLLDLKLLLWTLPAVITGRGAY
ncbi:MAG TPA: sugar transferase [Planctomycetaceae bacterium]|jgi:lipopolysaccharide/colanic/teichoic acid biosynthesis glycosyltransferase|nr:sugar transferase [Planctomycetaceae bacterium]